MKIHVATISEKALNVRLRESYYARQKKLFVVVIGLVSLLPFAIHIWASSAGYRESWMAKTSGDLEILANSRGETIAMFLNSQEDLLASYVELNRMDDLTAPGRLDRIFAAFQPSGVITDLGVIDRSGRHVAYAGPYGRQLAGRNYADAAWYKETMSSGRYVSDVFLGYRGVPHQIVAVADRERGWILRATINSELFNSLLKSADVGPGGDAFIVNRKGELQSPSRLGLMSIGADDVMMFGSLAADGKVKLTGGFLTASVPLKGGDWIMVLMTDVHASLAGFYAARQRDLWTMLVAGAAVLAVSTVLVRSMVGKIEEADRTRAALGDRVRQAEKMALVGRIAASVAHEVNNPLQIINDQAGLLGEMLDEEHGIPGGRLAEYHDSADSIKRNVRRASDVTHKLLGFSRSPAEVEAYADINLLVEETIGFLEKEAAINQIQILREFDAAIGKTITDPCQLQQVFLNILNNAMDAVGRDGSITVRTSMRGGDVSVEFADSGPGIPAEARNKLFDPFFSTKGERGTGLGLSISFNIMQRLGGSLNASSGPEAGSVFTVCVPFVPAKEAAAA